MRVRACGGRRDVSEVRDAIFRYLSLDIIVNK
jgi:hypothetical protein